MMFGGYKIEFTDICKPDMERYVLPYYENCKQGISFNLNTKNGKWDYQGSFGEKEIKMLRPKTETAKEMEKEKYGDKDIFYVEDDSIYFKGLSLMMKASHSKESEIIDEISAEINKKKFLALETDEERKIMLSKAFAQMDVEMESLLQSVELFHDGTESINDIPEIKAMQEHLEKIGLGSLFNLDTKSKKSVDELAKDFFNNLE